MKQPQFIIGSCGHNVVTKGHGYFPGEDARKADSTDYTLIYVAKGEQSIIHENGTENRLTPGTFIYYPTNKAEVRVNNSSYTLENYFVSFICSDISPITQFGFLPSEIYTTSGSPDIVALIESMINEKSLTVLPYTDLYCEAKFMELLVLLYRHAYSKIINSVPSFSSSAMTKIDILLYDEFDRNISLDEYAKLCNMSKYHFCRVFKKNYGISPITYRNRRRISVSCHYLENTNLSVSKIAQTVGFSSVTAYSDAFKKLFGISPAQYRMNYENLKNKGDITE